MVGYSPIQKGFWIRTKDNYKSKQNKQFHLICDLFYKLQLERTEKEKEHNNIPEIINYGNAVDLDPE